MLTVRYDVLGTRTGERLLDLGCGSGRHTYEGMKRGAVAVAVDLDVGLLETVRDVAVAVAVEESAARRVDGSFACAAADALHLPFTEAAFDTVIVSEVLEHVQRDEDALAEIARVLRPGGQIAVSVPRAWPERVCWLLSEQYHSNDGGHVRIYRRRDLLEKIRAAGFHITRSHHAHALHAPFWWLKCAVGVDREDHPAVRKYHAFLVRGIEKRSRTMALLEQIVDPLMGKSLVVYARKGSRV